MKSVNQLIMRVIRGFGLVLFVLGAIIAIIDLLDMFDFASHDRPFYGALALIIAGIGLRFLGNVSQEQY